MRFSGFRKIVSVILALTVVSSLFSFAQNGKTVFKYKTCDGKPLTDMEYHSEYSESYNSKTGYYTLTVNKVITTLESEALPSELDWWSMTQNISEIIIPEGIRVIGGFHYAQVEKVILPKSLEEIGKHAFYECQKLQSISIPKKVKIIRASAFGDCKSLNSVIFSKNAELNKLEGNCFSGCCSLKSISIPSKIDEIPWSAFWGCRSLVSIDLPKNLKIISEHPFADCNSLERVSLPNKLEEIRENAFMGCEKLKSIKIPQSVNYVGEDAFAGSGIRKFSGKFASKDGTYLSDKDKLLAVNDEWILKGAVPDGINDIGLAYSRSIKLRHIVIPASIKSIPENAFVFCDSLESVTIPESVTEIGEYAFGHCISLKRITLPKNLKSLGATAFKYCESLEELILPDSITEIGERAFDSCESLKRITLPDSITRIPYGAFDDCISLKEITLPDKLTSIGGVAFAGCESLEELILPDSITTIEGGAFDGCKSLKRITLPNSITAIKGSAFADCESLKSITLPNNLKSLGGLVFQRCKSLEELILPDSITEIGEFAFVNCVSLKRIILPKNLKSFGECTFYGCESLEELILPNSITEIGKESFEGCSSLKKITLPKNLKSIGEEAFKNCTSLEELSLPNSITEIGQSAFQGCTSLKKITLPNNLASIGGAAFNGCKSLEELTMSGSITEIGKSFLQSCKSIKKINITGGVSSIPDDYFKGLTQLTEVTLSEGLKSIGRRAFNNTGLIYVILPESLKEIGDGAFSNCHSLETVYINNPNTIFGYRTFANSENLEFITGDYDVAAFERAQANYGTKHKSIYEEKQKGIETQQEAERPESEMRVAGNVTMSEPTPDGAVDLGLSVKWATCNLGANSPEEYGGYYQWAGTRDVTSTSINLDWDNCPYLNSDDIYTDGFTGWTKYVPLNKSSFWSGSGDPDNKTVLDPSDDAAHVKLGGKWRIPTNEEWTELVINCVWIWTTQNGVNGYKVTSKKPGYTGKSIFLPAAGDRGGKSLDYIGQRGYYWSSSLYSTTNKDETPCYAGIRSLDSDYPWTSSISRYVGESIRPVYGDKVNTGVRLNTKNLDLNIGGTSTLRATVSQSIAAENGIRWISSDTGVATVDQRGKVTAVKAGYTTITVVTTDRYYSATCNVTVLSPKPVAPEAVDLGLSVKWGAFNIGATKPEEYGGYYQWAGIQDVASRNIPLCLNNCPYHTGFKSRTDWIKYIPSTESSFWSGSGNPDNKTVLDSSDDVAHVKLGGKWRMPTIEEWKELMDNCDWIWTTQNGIKGYKVTSKKSGYTGKSIFLPAAGERSRDDEIDDVGTHGWYWSSSIEAHLPSYAQALDIDSKGIFTNFSGRSGGLSVRPVSE